MPSLAGGGAERVFVELANQFMSYGYRVTLILASSLGPYKDEIDEGVNIISYGASGVLISLPQLVRYLRREKPDVIMSGLAHANVISILANFLAGRVTRCIISARSIPSVWYRRHRSLRSWALLQLMRITYRFADAIIVNSQAVASDLTRFLMLSRKRIRVIYNPLDNTAIKALSREVVAHDWCKPGAPGVLLGVGRLDTLKDFPTLIRAFSLIRPKFDCRLVILGEGPDRESLENLIHSLGLKHDVHLAGFVTNPFAWMRCARVVVSSSLSEGCPNAVMQSLACGTPVVCTDCEGGTAEILENGKWGKLVPPGDSAAMATAIIETLEATHQTDGRLRANDFAKDGIAREYLQIMLPIHIIHSQID
jgi:glycosyltransferase involved in cell wall biosynthesis